MAENMITASIVIYKSNVDELRTVLDCVIDSAIDNVYIVDNSPNDELRRFVDFSHKIEYIFGQGNIGYGSAHNIAIRKAIKCGSKHHVVINPDIYFDKGTIEGLATYMDANTNVGHVMPRIVYPNGDLQYLCKLLPTPMNLIGRRFLPFKHYVEQSNYRFEMRKSGYDKLMEVPFLSGCFMFLRVETLKKVNGFDDRFFMYCEDVDLCRRIGMSGYKTMYYPELTVVHAHKKESFKSKAMFKAHVKSAIKYFNKWGWMFDCYRKKTNRRVEEQL